MVLDFLLRPDEFFAEREQGDTVVLSLVAACWQGYVWTFGLILSAVIL